MTLIQFVFSCLTVVVVVIPTILAVALVAYPLLETSWPRRCRMLRVAGALGYGVGLAFLWHGGLTLMALAGADSLAFLVHLFGWCVFCLYDLLMLPVTIGLVWFERREVDRS